MPEKYLVEDNMIMPPAENPDNLEVVRGPNIKPLPINKPMAEDLAGQVLLKVGDNITTDHIMPAGAKVLPLRSNIPAISEYVFEKVDPSFATRARAPRVAASSWAAATTGRARAASTRPSRRCSWVCAVCW